jgi:hypothetical protein
MREPRGGHRDRRSCDDRRRRAAWRAGRGAWRGVAATGLVALAVAGGACGGGDDDDDAGSSGDDAVTTLATTVPDPQGQPADPQGTEAVGGVVDGEQAGFLVVVDPGLGVVTVDPVEYLTGADAVQAAAADGVTVTRAYVRDPEPGVVLELPLAAGVAVTVLGVDGAELALDVDGLVAALSPDALPEQVAYTATPYRIDVQDGVVVSLEQLPAAG